MCFFRKKEVKLPNELYEFPPYTGKIKRGPIITNTNSYLRYSYIISSDEHQLTMYKELLRCNGFSSKNDIRFDRGQTNTYIIIEKNSYSTHKIAYHKGK